eukprot:394444_1
MEGTFFLLSLVGLPIPIDDEEADMKKLSKSFRVITEGKDNISEPEVVNDNLGIEQTFEEGDDDVEKASKTAHTVGGTLAGVQDDEPVNTASEEE